MIGPARNSSLLFDVTILYNVFVIAFLLLSFSVNVNNNIIWEVPCVLRTVHTNH